MEIYMTFKNLLTSMAICLLAFNTSLAQANGQDSFNKLCLSCHVTSGRPTIAPPIFGVINHVKSAYPTKTEFVDRIVNWVANPQKEKSLMPGAIRRFGVMPKLPYDPIEVRLIAEYLYDGKNDLPAWYKEHFKAEHGQEPKN